ncbi:NACHT domain-containing NTPase [Amycolatopsis sp. 195334CR]|uniref:NACHT domain-containing protein n=1 Tax=Amycolatopsis sp. 195334CR TaxID=2814588 RepID=UPI001A8D7BB9|nr:NACHT domain-containing protein [Amycolatopsis sp. 195334CR]MBN6036849.1 NACHT domain-containing protein [Amycolatopsis sp. 195334CR]
MAGLESAALKLGGSVAQHAARFWLQRRRAKFERSASLAELAEQELGGPLKRRNLDNLVDRVETLVAEQLAPVLDSRFAALPDNEVEAAVLAVTDVLRQVDLSDEALLAADADPEALARRVREQFADRPAEVALAERAWPLYELALDQSCRHLVQVVRYLPAFQPAALAEVLSRLSRLEELLTTTPVTTLLAPRGTDHDTEFGQAYLRAVAKSLDRLELLGLPADEQPRLPLTVAYLSLRVSTTTRDRHEEREEKSWRGEMPVEWAVGRADRTLLRGEAGSGKTTLLHWLAVTAARAEFRGELRGWNGLVPFVVRLRTFAGGRLPAPEEFVAHGASAIAGLMPPGWVHRVLRGGAILLVDGVDEVPAPRRREVKAWLRELLDAHPSVKVVVTARPAAADQGWLSDEGFSAVTLDPMGPTNVRAFLRRWHDAAESAGVQADVATAHRRLSAQLERTHLRELAASPLLCAMLCALNLSHRASLPSSRMDLYAKALAMLLHLRDTERGLSGLLGDAEKRVLLRDLAWRLTLANRVELSRDEALRHLTTKLPAMPNVTADPEALLAHLLERSGVLREPVPGRVDFVHRTFQEYLAADEAVQQHHIPTLVAHAHLDTWRETVVMACGHATARQAGELVDGLLDRATAERRRARRLRLLAAACLETVRDIDPATHARVDAALGKLVPPRDLRETASLATVGHRVLKLLPTDLSELSDAKAAATVRTAALTGDAAALSLLSGYAKDPRDGVQDELQHGWQFFDPERYADEVLVDAPLRNGWLIVRSLKCLPFVGRLRHLGALSVYTDPPDDFGDLGGLPKLDDLMFFGDPDRPVDLHWLRDHPQLKRLRVYRAHHFSGLSVLATLSHLTDLGLSQSKPWEDLEFLRHTPRLVWLSLDNTGTLPNLDALHRLPELRWLVLTQYSADCLAATRPLPELASLALFDQEPELAPVPATFPALTMVNIRPAGRVDLSPLRALPLTELILQDYDGADLSVLGPSVKLKFL